MMYVSVKMAIALLLLPALGVASELSGQISTGGGYNTNPVGYYDPEPQVLGWTRVGLDWRSTVERGTIAVEYDGTAYSYLPQSAWSAHRHSLEASWSETTLTGLRYDYGVGAEGNWNHSSYSAYSYRGVSGFGRAKASIGGMPTEFSVRIRSRSHPESPEFDYRQLTFSVDTRHALPTRTTVAIGANFDGRTYTTQSVEDLFAGVEFATSRRLRIHSFVSQGLTESLGLRLSGWAQDGTGRSRWTDDYWYILDDPLAVSGVGGRLQLSWLAPAGTTLRFYSGGERVSESYVAADGGYGSRDDRTFTAGVVAEGYMPWFAAGRVVKWTAEIGSERRLSDDPDYSFDRLTTMLGVRYAW